MSAQEIDATTPELEVEEEVTTTETAVAPVVPLGNYSEKELRGNALFARLVQLADLPVSADGKDKTQWVAHKNEVEGCKIEQAQVDYCRYKAVRISTTFNCSMEVFQKFLKDEAQIRKYDVDLNTFEVVQEKPESVILYTNYKRQSRFIAPRDFVIESASKTLTPEEAVAEKLTADTNNEGVFIQNSTSVAGLKDVQKDWTRGTIYVFGYIAVAEGPTKLKVTNYACVDPSGKIPPMVADHTTSLSAKKIATIRNLCEAMQKQQ